MSSEASCIISNALTWLRAFKSLFGGTIESVATSASASGTFLKKFLAIAISNVAYLRAIMPEESFRDRYEFYSHGNGHAFDS